MEPGGFALLVASTDLRPPRGLPARSPSAPRASLGASSRSPARPRHRPRAPQPGPPVPPAPSTPLGPLRLLLRGASARCPARPRHRPPAPRPGPAFWLVISSSALLREALHWLVASAMPRYLVHRFLTQRIPTHAHGALSQPIRDRAEWVTAVASHQLALYQVTSRVLDRLFSYPERHNLSRLAFPIHFAGACCHLRHTDGLSGPSRSHIVWCLWGFCSIRSWPSACRTPNDANSPVWWS